MTECGADSATEVNVVYMQENVASLDRKHMPLKLEKYNCDHERRGLCIIINQNHVSLQQTRKIDRYGTDVDASEAEKVFELLGFQVNRFDDLTVTEMIDHLQEVSSNDHSDADCFACIILSHGDNENVYGTDGPVNVSELIDIFKGASCPTLAGKPKLFFIQACRGDKYDAGISNPDEVDSHCIPEDTTTVRKIPAEADVLIAYSVVPGYISWRNEAEGSWFMQSLTRVLRQCGSSLDILQILTLVNNLVAYNYESCTGNERTNAMKQASCFFSTLTKLLYFNPK